MALLDQQEGVAQGRSIGQQLDCRVFEELFNRCTKRACHFALCLLRDQNLAEDAVQEAFASVLTSAKVLPPKTDLEAFLFRVLLGKSLNLSRKRSRLNSKSARLRASTGQQNGSAPRALEEMERREVLQELRRQLDLLPQDECLVLLGSYAGGFSQRQIGRLIGLSQACVTTKHRIALQRLKKGLTEAGLAAAAPRVTADLAHEAALLDRPCSPELVGRLTRQALEMPARIHRGPRLARALPRKAQPQRLWLAVASVLGLAAAASILLGFRATTGLTGAPERTPDARVAHPAGSEQRRPFSKTFEFNRPAFPSEMRLLKGSWTWIPKAGPDGSGCMETGEEVSLVAFYFPRLLPPAKVTYSQLPRASKFLLNLPYVVYSDEGASRSFRSGTWGGFSYVFPSLKWPDSNLPSERAWGGPSSQTFEQIPISPCNVNGCRGLILRIHTNAKFRFDNLTVQGMEDCAGAEYPFAEERIKSLVMNAHKKTEVQVLSEFLPCGP